jgi:hypothetical protein
MGLPELINNVKDGIELIKYKDFIIAFATSLTVEAVKGVASLSTKKLKNFILERYSNKLSEEEDLPEKVKKILEDENFKNEFIQILVEKIEEFDENLPVNKHPKEEVQKLEIFIKSFFEENLKNIGTNIGDNIKVNVSNNKLNNNSQINIKIK